MTFHGRIKNGTVVLDDPTVLPEGTEVSVRPLKKSLLKMGDGRTIYERLKPVIGKAKGLHAWRRSKDANGKGGYEVFQQFFGKYNPINLGMSGDRTQHVLWRIQNGEIEGINPKVAVMMIGTNNLGGNTDDEIVAGVTRIVKELNEKLPKTKVLLLGVFPRGAKANDPNRARIKNINAQLEKLDDNNKNVKYLDIGSEFLDAEGSLSPEIMPDALHPNANGYQVWADAIQPALEELMR